VRTRSADSPSPVADYVCTAFPDDGQPLDSLLVGLIAAAVALPVAIFLQTAFELSNTVMICPDTWLMWEGWPTFFLGREANKEWHYARGGASPSRLVRWYARFYLLGEPAVFTLVNLWRRFSAWLRGVPPPWEDEVQLARFSTARVSTAGRMSVAGERGRRASVSGSLSGLSAGVSGDEPYEPYGHVVINYGSQASGGALAAASGATDEAVADARGDMITKRLLSGFGLLGVLVTWSIMAWFIFTCALLCAACCYLPAVARLLLHALPCCTPAAAC
jgi:hypothetical protein